MPRIPCRSCGETTFVLSGPIGRRHCQNCGEVLPLPLVRAKAVDRVRSPEVLDRVRDERPDGGGDVKRGATGS
jgi:hypothetical protein